jgi:hypothetical protein
MRCLADDLDIPPFGRAPPVMRSAGTMLSTLKHIAAPFNTVGSMNRAP